MDRKKWSAKTITTPGLLKFRQKRKWQIALRRYVLEKNVSVFYAPYFGLDIENMRKWVEMQFDSDTGWADFGEKWQFDHVVPVMYFDSADEEELSLCWNFTNIRVARSKKKEDRANWLNISAAKIYFEELSKATLYSPCKKMLEKIEKIEWLHRLNSEKQQAFIIGNRHYLDIIENYSVFEFELLNSGRSTEEVKKEIAFLKKFEN